jgi:hypothetical protein
MKCKLSFGLRGVVKSDEIEFNSHILAAEVAANIDHVLSHTFFRKDPDKVNSEEWVLSKTCPSISKTSSHYFISITKNPLPFEYIKAEL